MKKSILGLAFLFCTFGAVAATAQMPPPATRSKPTTAKPIANFDLKPALPRG